MKIISYPICVQAGLLSLLLIFCMQPKAEAKSIGESEKFNLQRALNIEADLTKIPLELSKSQTDVPHKPLAHHLDSILQKEKELKQNGEPISENSRQRRTILLNLYLFAKLMMKEFLFFGKKFFG